MHIEVPRPAPRGPFLPIRDSSALLLACAVAVVLGAQQPSKPQQPTFRTGVNFVRVDVYPTADGRPVNDLVKADFEVLEDGVPQAVETFEHIVVKARDIVAERVEPRTVREANEMAADARHRLFVIFLDTFHVTETSVSHSGQTRMPGRTTTRAAPKENPLGTRNIDRALASFLDRAIGPDDLFAALTPDMDPEQLSFSRRPETFEQLVKTVWGRRFSWDDLDPEEERWGICYPPDDMFNCYPGVLLDMVRRRREDLVLQSLRRLVQRLGDLREERKAVLLVSEGWARYRPDTQLARPLPRVPTEGCPPDIPKGKDIYIGTYGKLQAGTDPRTYMTVDWQQCEASRATLAHVDNDATYRMLLDEANGANTSFYPIDPRGLAVFATPMDYKDLPQTPTRLATQPADKDMVADATDMRERLETLRNLATATDGKMTETNDFSGGLKKIADDLSDYYLLGYYSTNAKADGKFRKISVRVKRPGVDVRARRGYLAATEAEVAARRAAAAAADPEIASRESALAALGTIRADRPFLMAGGVLWQSTPTGHARPVLWAAGEVEVSAARQMPWNAGADAVVAAMTEDGQPVATERATTTFESRAFFLRLATDVAPGEYVLRARVQGKAGGGAEASVQIRVRVPDAADENADGAQPLLFRRGPFSGPGFQPTADLRFRKGERLRVDVPVRSAFEEVSARLLDRKGGALPIPVAASRREDGGAVFASGEVALAPLALGDYLVELAITRGGSQEKTLTAFRIVP